MGDIQSMGTMESSPNRELAGQIKALAKEAGFVDCGIINASAFAEFGPTFDERMQVFPEARLFYEAVRNRIDPAALPTWAKSLVVCLHWYGKYKIPEGLSHISPVFLVDIRNPRCPDYLIAVRVEENLRLMGMQADRVEVPARLAGVKAGIVQRARNGFVYSKEYGSWVYLVIYAVDAELPVDEPTMGCPCPEGCRMCMAGCPTSAITEEFVMRADHCVAYLTFRAPEPIAPELWEKMETWVYGCDLCQSVCPLNRGKWQQKCDAPWLEELIPLLSLEKLATMDEKTYRTMIQPNFWYIPPENAERWRRNARRALEKKTM